MTQEGGVKRESSGLLSFHRLFHLRVYLTEEDISYDIAEIKIRSQISPCYSHMMTSWGPTYIEPGLYRYFRNTQMEIWKPLATSRTDPYRSLLPGYGVYKTLWRQNW
jgi:hypothetical protein